MCNVRRYTVDQIRDFVIKVCDSGFNDEDKQVFISAFFVNSLDSVYDYFVLGDYKCCKVEYGKCIDDGEFSLPF